MSSPEEVLRVAFEHMIRGVHTSIPCVVVAVEEDLNTQRVDVQPLIDMFGRDGTSKPRPTIYAVPVMFPASKSSAFTFPLSIGDTVLCVFSMRGLEAFKTGDGKPSPPMDYSDYAEKDAIAIPGLFPFDIAVNNPSKRTLEHSTKDTVVAHNIGTAKECEVRLKENGDIKITTPENITVQCKTAIVTASESAQVDTPSLEVNAQDTAWTGNITFTGNVELDGDLDQTGAFTLNTVDVGSHVHTGVTAGTASTAPMIPEP